MRELCLIFIAPHTISMMIYKSYNERHLMEPTPGNIVVLINDVIRWSDADDDAVITGTKGSIGRILTIEECLEQVERSNEADWEKAHQKKIIERLIWIFQDCPVKILVAADASPDAITPRVYCEVGSIIYLDEKEFRLRH